MIAASILLASFTILLRCDAGFAFWALGARRPVAARAFPQDGRSSVGQMAMREHFFFFLDKARILLRHVLVCPCHSLPRSKSTLRNPNFFILTCSPPTLPCPENMTPHLQRSYLKPAA